MGARQWLAALALGWAALWVAPAAQAAEAQWQDFRAPSADFAILMPGKPVPESMPNDKNTVIINYAVNLGETYWAVAYSELNRAGQPRLSDSELLAQADDLLGRARDGTLAATKATLRTQRKFKLGDIPALGMVADNAPDKQTFVWRYYIFHDREFQVAYVGPLNSETRLEIKHFFDSFRFIGP